MTGSDDTPTPAALPRRPEARAFSVEDLVLAVLSGQIRVPAFQRGMKWEPQDALDLLDSIDRGYPIGTLLLWQRPARSERLVFGSVVVDAPERHDALWVVDGQQRISSLTRSFAGKGHPDEPFAVFYDLATRTFKHLPEGQPPTPRDVPLTEVLDSARLVDWLVAHHELGVDRQAAISLGKRLREYQVLASVVTTEDERTVREIFRRANRTGKRLEDSEVFHGLYSHEGPAPASLKDVARSLADLAFGPLDEETLLSMLLATRGTEIDKDRVPELQPAEAHRAMIDLERSARATITFLRHDAGISHVSLLPFRSVLLVLARFFRHHPEPHPRSRELLVRWLWRGAASGTHAPPRAAALAAIDGDEHATLQRLLQTLQGGDPMRLLVGPHGDQVVGAYARLNVLAMLELQPRDLRTGELVAPGPDALATADPYRGLVQRIVRNADESLWSNQIIHPAMAVGMVETIVACEDPAILASHAIPLESREALRDHRYQDFLTARRRDVFQLMLAFVERRAEWGEPDTPPVEALLVRGD